MRPKTGDGLNVGVTAPMKEPPLSNFLDPPLLAILQPRFCKVDYRSVNVQCPNSTQDNTVLMMVIHTMSIVCDNVFCHDEHGTTSPLTSKDRRSASKSELKRDRASAFWFLEPGRYMNVK